MGARNRYQLSFDFEEAGEMDRCVCYIREDLGVIVPVTYQDALYLAEVHGGAPVLANTDGAGETVGENIYVNPALADDLAVVILHELVHRLANGPRYEELNPVHTQVPRRQWIEELARRVSGQ
jgi:hypothetical protein